MKIFKFPKGKQKCHVSHRFRLESDRCRLPAMADRAVTFDPATKLPPAFVLLGRRPLASSRLFCWDKYIKTTHFIFLDPFFFQKNIWIIFQCLNCFICFDWLSLRWWAEWKRNGNFISSGRQGEAENVKPGTRVSGTRQLSVRGSAHEWKSGDLLSCSHQLRPCWCCSFCRTMAHMSRHPSTWACVDP